MDLPCIGSARDPMRNVGRPYARRRETPAPGRPAAANLSRTLPSGRPIRCTGTALHGPWRDLGQSLVFPSARLGRLLCNARGLPRGPGADPIEVYLRSLNYDRERPRAGGYFSGEPRLLGRMGETARSQARLGELTEWLARRYADVWPARGDDLPGELWRPVPGVEGFDCSSLGRVRHYPTRVGRHAGREPSPEEPQHLVEVRRGPGDPDGRVTLSSPTVQPETFAVSELVAYVFGEVARREYLRMATGAAPEPAREPDADPTCVPPTAVQPGAGTVAAAGPPPNGFESPTDANVWRRVAGWPYDANRAGQVRSYHDTKARRIAPTPQRILKRSPTPYSARASRSGTARAGARPAPSPNWSGGCSGRRRPRDRPRPVGIRRCSRANRPPSHPPASAAIGNGDRDGCPDSGVGILRFGSRLG